MYERNTEYLVPFHTAVRFRRPEKLSGRLAKFYPHHGYTLAQFLGKEWNPIRPGPPIPSCKTAMDSKKKGLEA